MSRCSITGHCKAGSPVDQIEQTFASVRLMLYSKFLDERYYSFLHVLSDNMLSNPSRLAEKEGSLFIRLELSVSVSTCQTILCECK